MKTLSRSISKNFEKTLRKLKIKEPGAQQLVQLEIDVQILITGYRTHMLKLCVYYMLCVLSLGLIYVLCSYYPKLECTLTARPIALRYACFFLIQDSYNSATIHKGFKEIGPVGEIYILDYRNVRMVFEEQNGCFIPTGDWKDESWVIAEDLRKPMSAFQITHQQLYFGKNAVVTEREGRLRTFLRLLNPLYLVQFITGIIWILNGYFYVTVVLWIFSLFAILFNFFSVRSNYPVSNNSTSKVTVYRGNKWLTMSSEHLVPGDLIDMANIDTFIPFDGFVVTGECLVNESMLTGEPSPIRKYPASDTSIDYYDNTYRVIPQELRGYFLQAGTILLSVSGRTIAVVARTAYNTTKGQMIRSTLFRNNASGYGELFKFIFFFGILNFTASVIAITQAISLQLPVKTKILEILRLFCAFVSPFLPFAVSLGVGFSLRRYSKRNIVFSAPQLHTSSIGKISLICYDKTGTITEEAVTLLGVQPVYWNDGSSDFGDICYQNSLYIPKELLHLMATCHDNLGDPIDEQMRTWAASRTEENVIKRFNFQPDIGCMTVIAGEASHFTSYTKGSPDVILRICNPRTIPADYHSMLFRSTSKGYRVLACAYRPIPVSLLREPRDHLERDMIFLGFLIFENCIKPEVPQVVKDISEAQIRQIMVTGDDLLTSVTAARACGLIPLETPVLYPCNNGLKYSWEGIYPKQGLKDKSNPNNSCLVVTGEVMDELIEANEEKMISQLLDQGSIFARFTPEGKKFLVEKLKERNYTVAFCGDGINDYSALKAADVGMALTNLNAMFTCKINGLDYLPYMISQGRAALVIRNSFFKYTTLHSFAQAFSSVILLSVSSRLSNKQFLFLDVFLLLPMIFLLSRSEALTALSTSRPHSSVISPWFLSSLFVQLLYQFGVLFLAFVALHLQRWYEPPVTSKERLTVECFDNTVIFYTCAYQCLLMPFIFYRGFPFLRPFYTNILFTLVFLLQTAVVVFLLFSNNNNILALLDLKPLPLQFRIKILVMSVFYFVFARFIETFLFNSLKESKVSSCCS